MPDFRDALLHVLRQNKAERRVFADATFVLSSQISPSGVIPFGIIFQIVRSKVTGAPAASVWRSAAQQETSYFRRLIVQDRALLRESQTREAILAHVNNLALIFYRAGLRSEATREWDYALQIEPSYRDALVNRGVALDEDGASSRSRALFRRARGLYPDDPLVRYQMAVFYLRHNEPRRALVEFRAASQLNPQDATALFDYAVLLARSGEREKSIAQLRRLLHLNPQHERARELLNALSR
jgi:tetratricopeptide (TPR) repeat protein